MMIVLRDAVSAIAKVTGCRDSRLHRVAACGRRESTFATSPGLPLPLSRRQIAILLLGALTDAPPDVVAEYASAATTSSQRLDDAIAAAIDAPALFERLQLDLDSPSAMLVTSGDSVRYFGLPGSGARFAIFDGERFEQIISALKDYPPRRAGRPTRANIWN